jgi:uncharacterized protein (TIGR02266 family)
MSSDPKDRRVHPRHPLVLQVTYDESKDYLPDWTENISAGGLFVRTALPFAEGQRLRVSLSFPGVLEPVTIEGTVVWRRPATGDQPGGVGLRVDSDLCRRRLARLALAASSHIRPEAIKGEAFEVVVADDNPFMQEACGRVLQDLAEASSQVLRLRKAGSGHEALAACQARLPDLLITDSHMPVMDGAALIERLRSEKASAELPVIVLGAGAEGDRNRFELLGIDAYLQKPIQYGELLETLVYLVYLRTLAAPDAE